MRRPDHGFQLLSSGEEAVAVGLCAALPRTTSCCRAAGRSRRRWRAASSRGAVMAELLGKAAGPCRGKGGRGHLAQPAAGFFGAHAVVGGNLTIAAGVALALQLERRPAHRRLHVRRRRLRRRRAARDAEHRRALEAAAAVRLRQQPAIRSRRRKPAALAPRAAVRPGRAVRHAGVDGRRHGRARRARRGRAPSWTARARATGRRSWNACPSDSPAIRPRRARRASADGARGRRGRAARSGGWPHSWKPTARLTRPSARAALEREVDARGRRCAARSPNLAVSRTPPRRSPMSSDAAARHGQTVLSRGDRAGAARGNGRDDTRHPARPGRRRFGGSYKEFVGLFDAIRRRSACATRRWRRRRWSALGVGAAAAGMRPLVSITYMDFLMLGLDPLVNYAAKARFKTGGQITAPVVVKTTAGAKGQGVAHSQCIEAWLMGVPGLKVVAPVDAGGCLWPDEVGAARRRPGRRSSTTSGCFRPPARCRWPRHAIADRPGDRAPARHATSRSSRIPT